MDKKEEFKKLMEEIVDAILKESASSKDSKIEFSLITKNMLHMLMNLNQQIEGQREYLNKLEGQAKRFNENFKLLIKELRMSS